MRGAGLGMVATVLLATALGGCGGDVEPVPPAWRDLVQTRGQHYPVPRAWLATEEARIAHDLVLPDVVPKPVPFDFDAASGPWYWPRSKREVAVEYFRHLCRTEAGEWILERPEEVEGFYFARPAAGQNTERYVNDIYGVEAPWVESYLIYRADKLKSAGLVFISPPFRRYKYVQQPKRDVGWQSHLQEPFIQMEGYQTTYEVDRDGNYRKVEEVRPMRVMGIRRISTEYGYSWRGISRPYDRHHRISGSELIIFRIPEMAVIAVMRNYLIGRVEAEVDASANWMLATSCKEVEKTQSGLFISDFVRKVLKEPIR